MTASKVQAVKILPLNDAHEQLGAKMVPFAGYAMPVQYSGGIIAEHLHTRAAAGLFDVSHMGQVFVTGPDAATALEKVLPVDVAGLAAGEQRYALLLNDDGGILDDLMITNAGDHWLLVVNAGCKYEDLARIRQLLPDDFSVELDENRALLALQGPAARQVMGRLSPALAKLPFMRAAQVDIDGIQVWASCSGYTGEDGYELALAAADAPALFARLLAEEEVQPIGLGARDSLRLEAGLCLYGSDLNPDIDPVTANLKWSISPVRRTGGARAGGYPGADNVAALWDSPPRSRTLLDVDGKAPLRAGVPLVRGDESVCGEISSGGFGPSVQKPVAMGFVDTAVLASGEPLFAALRGRKIPVSPRKKPFVEQRYVRNVE